MANQPVRLPLLGNPTNRQADDTKDQRFLNCFPEMVKNDISGTQKLFVLKRPGTEQYHQPAGATGEGRGCYAWNGYFFTVIGNKLYATDITGAPTSSAIKTLATSTGAVGFVEFLGASQYLVLVDGTDGYYISTTNVVTEITDVDFPTPHQVTPVFMDGYLFLMKDTGEIFNCDVGDITSWNATNFIEAESFPDAGIAIARQNNLLVAFSERSTEFFYDAANSSGSPLAPATQYIKQYGLASVGSIAQEESMLVFVAKSGTGNSFVVANEGTKDTMISTAAIDRIINAEGTYITDSWGYLVRQLGHMMYVLNLPAQSRTLVYDFSMQMWHEWNWQDSSDVQGVIPFISNMEADNGLFYLHQADGYIYEMRFDLYQDGNGKPINTLIQTSRYDGESAKIKFCAKTEVIGDHQTSSNNLTVYWSDDDYKTWTTGRTVDLSSRAFLYRCGSFRRRAFLLTHTANSRLRLEALELELIVGVH